MTDDRTLLERAAQAAGITLPHWMPDGSDDYWLRKWNPLEDDGDALRLAVKLNIIVEPGKKFAYAMTVESCCEEVSSADPYAATRRAIVRAAAAMAGE